MVSYKTYENQEFNIADSPFIVDLNADIGGGQPFNITCDKKEIGVALEFEAKEGFEDIIPLFLDEGLNPPKRVLRARITTTVNNAGFRAIGGID